jgi:hypothetical protein
VSFGGLGVLERTLALLAGQGHNRRYLVCGSLRRSILVLGQGDREGRTVRSILIPSRPKQHIGKGYLNVRTIRFDRRHCTKRVLGLRKPAGSLEQCPRLILHDRYLRVRARDVTQAVDGGRVLFLGDE